MCRSIVCQLFDIHDDAAGSARSSHMNNDHNKHAQIDNTTTTTTSSTTTTNNNTNNNDNNNNDSVNMYSSNSIDTQ